MNEEKIREEADGTLVIVDEQLNASVEKSDGVLTPYEEFFNDGSDGADLTCTVSYWRVL